MTPIEALELALQKEQQAIDIYGKLASEHSAIKDLLLDLQGEEYKHRRLIEKKITELRMS